jgi:hypothetical protein
MRQFITFSIDAHGVAAVLAHPCDTALAHKAAAESCKLTAWRTQTDRCKRVQKASAPPPPKVQPKKRAE